MKHGQYHLPNAWLWTALFSLSLSLVEITVFHTSWSFWKDTCVNIRQAIGSPWLTANAIQAVVVLSATWVLYDPQQAASHVCALAWTSVEGE